MHTSRDLVLAVYVLMAWVGLLVHNVVESVDGSTFAVALISAGLFLAWWRIPFRRTLTARLLLIMGIVELIGAIVTVMPLGLLPFIPEQSLTHYLSHAAYGVTQLPLIITTTRMIQPRS